MVVDLAVAHHVDVAGFVAQWLIATLQIDDAQPIDADATAAVEEEIARVVLAPMHGGRKHGFEHRSALHVVHSDNSAHSSPPIPDSVAAMMAAALYHRYLACTSVTGYRPVACGDTAVARRDNFAVLVRGCRAHALGTVLDKKTISQWSVEDCD